MDASSLPLLLPAAAVAACVLLVALCLDCRNKSPLVSIPQTHASDDYIRSTDFRIINSSHRGSDLASPGPPSHLLSPHPPPTEAAPPMRLPSYTPTETESNPSYENPGPESADSDADEPGYILVLPEGDMAPPTLSRASTPSSDVQHNYVNMADNQDYVNVQPASRFTHVSAAPSEDDDSDDDEQGNYVNQPAASH